ncbi:carbohydrate sulfotransferase 1-like [Saccoglossus kowalevskii]|uniref:Carbohydrate sulfotransferase 1-like n=1 Tax=Saccoglossus kowalevskii TaxID=10224 RepID=A0ABM0GTP5_SACKO|nr:PREDICTED: carbohydrate sulfotransferase 1-like [Saccoglossus kowalevskii]
MAKCTPIKIDDTMATGGGNQKTEIGQDGTRVALVAAFRTGSTFTGELLNQNPDIFYLFEPFRLVRDIIAVDAIGKDLENSTKLELLRDIFACRFPAYFVHHIRHWGLAVYESKALKNACMLHGGCANTTPEVLAETCDMYKHVAMKVIRLQSLELLQPLAVRDEINLKVLHLIRDPRGVASSRKYFHKGSVNKTITNIIIDPMKEYCQCAVEMIEFSSNLPDWLRGRYKRIRYEDIAVEPLNSANRIYKFLNLPLPASVKDWIDKNTKSDNVKSKGNMSLSKNSTVAAQSWRSRLLYEDIEIIQNLPDCSKLMHLMSYHRVDNPIQMTDMSFITF